ncbi:MAG: hypothetical protein ACOX1M_05515 [Erysipelotrichaceae bacterium]
MIYCKLENVDENAAIYKYGNSLEKMNNILRIPTKNISNFSTIHYDSEDFFKMYVKWVLVKYMDKLKSGNYPDIMTYISR